MRAEAELQRSWKELMEATLHAVCILALHLTGKHRLPQGEVDRLVKILDNFLEAIDALP